MWGGSKCSLKSRNSYNFLFFYKRCVLCVLTVLSIHKFLWELHIENLKCAVNILTLITNQIQCNNHQSRTNFKQNFSEKIKYCKSFISKTYIHGVIQAKFKPKTLNSSICIFYIINTVFYLFLMWFWHTTSIGWKVHRLTKELCHSNETWHALNSSSPNTKCIVSI